MTTVRVDREFIETDRLVLSAGELDPVTSFYYGTWVVLEPGGTSFYPVRGRNVGHQEWT